MTVTASQTNAVSTGCVVSQVVAACDHIFGDGHSDLVDAVVVLQLVMRAKQNQILVG